MAEDVTYADIKFTNIQGQRSPTITTIPAQPGSPHTQPRCRRGLLIALGVTVCVLLAAVAVVGILWKQNSSDWERKLEKKEEELEKMKSELEGNQNKSATQCNDAETHWNDTERYRSEAERYRSEADRYRKQLEKFCVDPSTGKRKQQCCPEGWKGGDSGRCYYVSTDQRSWVSANQSCSSVGAQLLVINDKKELELLGRLVKDNSYYWIGLSRKDRESQWRWVDGTVLDSKVVTAGTGYYGYCGYWSRGSSTVYSRECRETHPWICEGDAVRVWQPPSLS
ncbi:C-type lectin domain family 12 member B-like isoform X3 [Lepisosteus oculatus]|uniref:C-type lectin domain family 12 member B-like isoform X3 n=1 Tax=Lepisosteus oculatus TaxID=7918 RepID=UPI0035F52067